MTAQDFVYWLQGFNEIQQTPPTPEQWKIVQDHLALVFKKVTPNRTTLSSGHPTYCSDASVKLEGIPPFVPPVNFGPFPFEILNEAEPARTVISRTC